MKKTILACTLLIIRISVYAQWAPFGTAAPSYVIGFETWNDTLYSYGQPDPHIYKWDNTDWVMVSQVTPGSAGTHHIRNIDSVLYMACYASGTSNHVYYWQNGSWQTMGAAFQNTGSNFYPSIYDIIKYNNSIYVCGDFNRIGTDTITGVARWDGTQWVAVGGGLSGGLAPYNTLLYPHQFLLYGNDLLLCGNFKFAGTDTVNGIARWNGSGWSGLGQGFDRVAYGMGLYNGNLFASGEFSASGATGMSCIASWNGTSWTNPGFEVSYVNQPNLNKFVHTVQQVGNDLYFAGGFNRVKIGSTYHVANNVLRYTGSLVDTLEGGTNYDMEGIYPYQGMVLFGGGCSQAGTVNVHQTTLYDPLAGIFSPAHPENAVQPYPVIFEETVSLKNYQGQKGNYALYSMDGKLVSSGTLSARIFFGKLPAAMYLLELNMEESSPTYHRIISSGN